MFAGGVMLSAGCSRLETGGSETPGTVTSSSASNRTQTPSTSEKRETPQDRERGSRCTTPWNSDPVWRFDTRWTVESVVAGDQSAFALGNESAAALDPATGRAKWTVSVDESWGTFEGASFESDNLLLVVGSRRVVAIDTDAEAARWSYTVPGREQTAVISDATVQGGVLYLGAVNAETPSFEPRNPYTRILAIDLETGDHRTFFEVSADGSLPTLYSLNADDSGVYAGLDGSVVAHDFDGREQWRTAISPSFAPALAEAILVVPTETGLVGIATDSGTRHWTNQLAPRKITTEDGIAYASTRSRTENGVAAVDARNGTVEWRATTAGRGDGPVASDGVVYVPVERESKADRLGAFDSRSGCRIGSLDFDSDGLYRVAVGDERVFTVVGVSHGELRAYETASPP